MSDLEVRIAEVLANHQRATHPDNLVRCECGWGGAVRLTSSDHREHQAAMLTPLIRDAQAEAHDSGRALGNHFDGHMYPNPYRSDL